MNSLRPKVVVLGASGHALVVADVIRKQGLLEIAGFLDDVQSEKYGQIWCGASVLGGSDLLHTLSEQGVRYGFVAIGDCTARGNLALKVLSAGLELASAIHPSAIVADSVKTGRGTAIMAGAVINPYVLIGENVIINTSASIDHECIVEDNVHISPGAHLAGRVFVGHHTWIGLGAVVKDGVSIGANSLIGAGAVVIDDIPERTVAYGVPCRPVRTIQA